MGSHDRSKAHPTDETERLKIRLAALEKSEAEDKRRIEEIHSSEARWRALIETAPDVIYSLSGEDGAITSLNPAFERITGWPIEEWLGKPLKAIVHPDDLPLAEERFRAVLLGETPPSYELRLLLKSGAYLTVEFTSAPQVEGGNVVGHLGIIRDVSSRKRLEETIIQLAYHDPVTGLPNRVLFSDRLNLALAHARRGQEKLAVMLLDLDRFKNVNDGLGHNVGDRLLKAVGERLCAHLRKSDTVARLGGDEFLLLLPDMLHETDMDNLAAKVLESIREPFVFGSQSLRITTSIGMALYPRDGDNADELLTNADIAMYRAKEAGRDNAQHYRPDMRTQSSDERDEKRPSRVSPDDVI